MNLLEKWRNEAYENEDEREAKVLWDEYFDVEEGIYSEILDNPSQVIKGKVSDLAEGYKASLLQFTGFLDGINESLNEPLELEELEEDTEIEISIDPEKLYFNMLEEIGRASCRERV